MNDYTKSVDELVKRKSHPRSLPAYGAQTWSQIRRITRSTESKRIALVVIVGTLAAASVGFAVYSIVRAVSS